MQVNLTNVQSDSLSFAAASVAVRNTKTGDTEQIDLPMRASAGGYYDNLMRMYGFLEIPLHPIRFLFVFAKAFVAPVSSSSDVTSVPGAYFVHASNLHKLIPPRPANRGLLAHALEILFLIICQFWFTVACFVVTPYSDADSCETFQQYVDRIWLPRRYVSHYLLPLMSSVSTCTHSEMQRFPASDVVNYKKHSHGQHHFAVCGGAHQVQQRLTMGIEDIRLRKRILSLDTTGSQTTLRYQGTEYGSEVREEVFDKVILAVSPDVAAKLYQPVRSLLETFPTVQASSSVLSPDATSYEAVERADSVDGTWGCSHHLKDAMPAQIITFKTVFSGESESRTEALHTMPSGVVVSTCPLSDEIEKGTLQAATFTRTLRTAESRATVQRIMGESAFAQNEIEWRNGQDNVWLAGAWCWDGMVLLEGCVVSAMRVARDLGVEVPWVRK